MLPDTFRRLKPLFGKRIDALWIEYQLADPERKREIDELLTILAVQRLGIAVGDERIVLEPPTPTISKDGDYEIGMVAYPGMLPFPFRVGRNELLRHVFILGPTGTGKSTLIISLLDQLLADGVPITVLDFKRNFRVLLAKHATLRVTTVGRDVAPLALNVLRPPASVPVTEWVDALADIISSAYLLMHGARNVLKEALLSAINEYGADARVRDALAVIRNQLATSRGGSRRYGWLESTYRSLEELTKGTFGTALNATTSESLDHFFGQAVVYEVHGLGDDQKRFFCLYLLQYLALLRKNSSAPREQLRHVLVFDEAQHVFPKDPFGTLSVPSRLVREIREYGDAVIAATQQSDVSESLIANSGFKIIMRCDFPRDVDFASRLLQIEPRWIPKIPLGSAILRLPIRYYSPFLITFPPQPIKNTVVADAAVRERWTSRDRTAPATDRPALSEKERLLLADVYAHPISTITGRYARLGWNGKIGNTIKDQVLANGSDVFTPVATPTARVKILCLTTRGYAALGAMPTRAWRAGGVEHEYWRHRTTEVLSAAGWTVHTEYDVGEGHTVDLCAEQGTRRVFIEIETGHSDLPHNIAKAQDPAAFLVIVCTSSVVRDRWRDRIPPDTIMLIPAEIDALPQVLA
jgi:hypothetical protein